MAKEGTALAELVAALLCFLQGLTQLQSLREQYLMWQLTQPSGDLWGAMSMRRRSQVTRGNPWLPNLEADCKGMICLEDRGCAV